MPQLLCKCGAPATAARLYPGTENRPVCVLCASIDRLEIPSIPERSVAIPDHLLGSKSQQIHPHSSVYNHQAVALNLLYEGQTSWSQPHCVRENPGFHDACTAHNRDRSRRHSPGFLPRQGPRQRPINPLEGRRKRSRNGPRGRPSDHRRHAHAPPGSRFEQGKSGPRAPRCGPRMAHPDCRGAAPKTVFGQPPGGGHRRGTRLRGRARVQRSLHVSPPGRCHNPRPKPYFIQYIAATATIRSPEKHSDPRKTHGGPDRPDLHEGRFGRERSTHTPPYCFMCPTPRTRKTRKRQRPGCSHPSSTTTPRPRQSCSTTPARGQKESPAWPAVPIKSWPTGPDICRRKGARSRTKSGPGTCAEWSPPRPSRSV